jgi:hypothetical protein
MSGALVAKRGRGRPSHQPPGASEVTWVRLKPATKEFLLREAAMRGWSLSAEVAARIERSLETAAAPHDRTCFGPGLPEPALTSKLGL